MRSRNILATAALTASISTVLAIGTNDQVDADIGYGTFEAPSANVRPRFRYWVPDASVNLSQVAADIKDVKRVGAGGVELLGYYNYGDTTFFISAIPTDWTKYGWGTPAWRQLQDTALKATKDNDLIIDLALGPNQGAGVPAPYNSDGIQWDLQPFNVTVPIGGNFNDLLPGWGTGPLVSASIGLLTKTTNETTAIYKTLSQQSMVDVTNKVNTAGRLTYQFPAGSAGESYVVFAYYLVHTGFMEQRSPLSVIPGVPQSPVTSYVQNGSWVVDHFSTKGAKLVTDFWEQHLLNGSDTSQLLKQVGNYVWEDSQEYPANILWTPGLASSFQTSHGYSVNKYLPILLAGNSGFSTSFGSSVIPIYYVTDEIDSGASYVADYRQTLTNLNAQFLQTLTSWAHSIGVQSSTQVVYNLPMDMLANIPDVDAPETETLGFSHNIDSYRQYAGPANLAGKRIISSEAGAVQLSAYQQTIPELLWDLKRSIVGGVNNFILHGYPYTGNYPNSTWPSWTTFGYRFSEMHNRHQPGWDFYSDFMNYISRVQYVSQSGVPKRDIVFWLKDTSFTSVPTRYWPTDLQNAGYTYEYLSPDDFNLPDAQVLNGVLAPSHQSFKAIVVRGNDTLTSSGVSKLAQWAHQGLPVVFSGGIPSNISGTSGVFSSSIKSTLTQLLSLKNVHSVPYTNLAQSLSSIGITPRTAVSKGQASNTTWFTNWREDVSISTSYVFIYNDATGLPRGSGASTGNITFEATGTPYIYDAWTGNKTPVASYQQWQNTTTITIALAGNQTTILAFERGSKLLKSSVHVEHSSEQLKTMPGANNIVNFGHKSCSAKLSNGSTITVPSSDFSPIALKNWTLTVESWTAPSNMYDVEGTVKTNSTFTLNSLVPWNQIPNANLSNVSGRGYYTVSFTWPPASSSAATGAQLNLGSIIHTARASLNGFALPPLDVADAKADLTPYLKKGVNELQVVVATPYGNALRPIWANLKSYGDAPNLLAGVTPPVVAEYGLVGDVFVVPFVGVRL
ncbi:hypothetical protein D6D22_04627 [Aureobasidium pullulans]|uniref:Secreted protein n=1 Tax=Aureobasidium pullulans TaxID=5580 RepID=A0A4S8XR12_AURPU|nr:hypothetical protein D6D22_04627 [Aureobasidium pullulans]